VALFPALKWRFGEKSDVMCMKQTYLYDYCTSLDKFHLPGLPERHHFYNKLTKEECSESAYQDALNVFEQLGANAKRFAMIVSFT
jgi:hypothetical protein